MMRPIGGRQWEPRVGGWMERDERAAEASGLFARRCERAVVTAYRELRACGTSDISAFTACTTLYRIHHPEAPLSEARRLVAEWIDHHVVRGAAGPTPGCACGEEPDAAD